MSDADRRIAPDPDAIYEATTSFVSFRVPGSKIAVREGDKLLGSEPVVILHLGDGHFRLAAIEDRERRERAELLELLRAQAASTTTVGAPTVATPVRRSHMGPDPLEVISVDRLEELRRELADVDEPHGYDTLAKRAGVSRATVQRRYEPTGVAPGEPIPGVCDQKGKRHPH